MKYHRLKNNFDVSTDFKTNVKGLINNLNGKNTGIHGLERPEWLTGLQNHKSMSIK